MSEQRTTGERRRREDAALSTSARYDRRVVELAVAQEQLRRLRERVALLRHQHTYNTIRNVGEDDAMRALFAELDAQDEKGDTYYFDAACQPFDLLHPEECGEQPQETPSEPIAKESHCQACDEGYPKDDGMHRGSLGTFACPRDRAAHEPFPILKDHYYGDLTGEDLAKRAGFDSVRDLLSGYKTLASRPALTKSEVTAEETSVVRCNAFIAPDEYCERQNGHAGKCGLDPTSAGLPHMDTCALKNSGHKCTCGLS